jgi:hypothetical protein
VNKKLEKEREKEKQRLEAIKRKQENKELVEREIQEIEKSSKKLLIYRK